jgi:type VI secretion system secreted protein VgrG
MATATETFGASEFDFETGVHPAGDLRVLTFEAHEELSRQFSLTVTLAPRAHVFVDPAGLIGGTASLTVHLGDDADRHLNGIVVRAEAWEEVGDHDRRRLRIEVAPALARLRHVRRSRIFQELSVPEIVERVLTEGQVAFRSALRAGYKARGFCVQYDEWDLDFVQRLLEEEGISYFFEHQKDEHTLVLVDSNSACPSLENGERIVFREPGGHTPGGLDHVDAFSPRLEVRAGKVSLQDFDCLHPALDLGVSAEAKDQKDLELDLYPGGYTDSSPGKARARSRLEAERFQSTAASGSSNVRRLQPGRVFELDEHPIDDFNAKYLLLSVDHRGDQRELLLSGASDAPGDAPGNGRERYRNTFVCADKQVTCRPERRTPRPRIAGVQTAVVTGPADEEIHCDEHGRIKVRFHWDREGPLDDRSSCWVRVSQAWAGPGFGALYLPRVGQEVVVEFLDGDPDRPVVSGSVYNRDHPPPLNLPAEKSRSTLRSSSSPGGDGFNELRFEDAAGQEEIWLHAQRNLRVVVENDRIESIGRNQSVLVEQDRSCLIEGNRTVDVKKDDSVSVSGDQALHVVKDRSVTVDGSHLEQVMGDQSVHVEGDLSLEVSDSSTESVAFAKRVDVGGAYTLKVGDASGELIDGIKAEEVGGARKEKVSGDKSEELSAGRTFRVDGEAKEKVTKGRTVKVGKNLTLGSSGKLTQTTKKAHTVKAKEIQITAEESFTAKVGSAKIKLEKSGQITVEGGKVELNSSGDLILKGNKITEN